MPRQTENNDESVNLANEEVLEDLRIDEGSPLTVASRDWTVETICSQIFRGNVDLAPKFQRRNAWNDEKRSRLIESLVMGYPVPEIVLAEVPQKRGTYIVIDGKQRLLALSGFIDSEKFPIWNEPKISNLKILKQLNGRTYADLRDSSKFFEEGRRLANADIRCTLLTGYRDDDILYDVFYRLNTGSVPLSTQELRQVLNRGPFADYLISSTNEKQPLHKVMGLSEPDNRLRDSEIILRFLSLKLFGKKYRGNLKRFLDESMGAINNNWSEHRPIIEDLYARFNDAIEHLSAVFGGYKFVGRKYVDGRWEASFNRAIFEVQAYYFSLLSRSDEENGHAAKVFKSEFERLCSEDEKFLNAVQQTTKSQESYSIRFDRIKKLVNKAYGKDIREAPLP